jgi:hypothetical protein
MTGNVSNGGAVKRGATRAETRQEVFTEIRAKWGKFSEQDLSALKDSDDLVTQLVV